MSFNFEIKKRAPKKETKNVNDREKINTVTGLPPIKFQ